MTDGAPGLEQLFRRIVAWRVPIVLTFLLLTPVGLWFALRVPQDNAIERLIVQSDPDYQATRAFHAVFPEGQHVVLVLEAPDPFAPPVLRALIALEGRLAELPGVQLFSALGIYRQLRPGFDGAAPGNVDFRAFARGTHLFGQQGLAGETFLGVAVTLARDGPTARDAALGAIDDALAGIDPSLGVTVRRIGGPYIDSYLEGETRRASLRYFPLFGLFVIALNLALFRSFRTLAAMLLTLAVSVVLSVGLGGAVGFAFTIVSSLVPLTILITCTATLVYLQSRFVDQPSGVSIDEHQVFALGNKFLACTASVFAAAVGFAALGVSRIRPIRELGWWVALGLVITWITCFTLFPALQKLLNTPTLRERRVAGAWFQALAERVPERSYRWRWPLVSGAAVLCAAGAIALFGLPGFVAPMQLEVGALDYIEKGIPIYRDTRWFEEAISGLSVTELWIKTPEGQVLDPGVLSALDRLSRRIEKDPDVGSAVGLTTLLRFVRYAKGLGDVFPTDPGEVARLAGEAEQLLLAQPELRGFVDVGTLAQTHVTVIHRDAGRTSAEELRARLEAAWRQTVDSSPALAGASMSVVGQGLLQAKISEHLVPTLVESFALTAAIIFVTFLVVFRSGAARLMAMIPSVFAILVMFLVMRLTGIPLNVATILIASTVLGASENDQIHFFYHFQEKRRTGSTEEALRHTLRVSGQAIVFATFINAGGFLALALSGLPPMRQFGIISACAFLLSMIADFTALPAALWIFFREKPDRYKGSPGA